MIKGIATIQLFDAKTGELVYEKEHSNIITNTYKNLLQPNIPLDIGFGNSYKFHLRTLTPLVDKVFGGVLLLAEEKDGGASASNILITKRDFANFIGCGGGPGSFNSIYKGNFNEVESGWNEEAKEYKLVWDFPSNAANGKISTICLCPRYLGDNGLKRDPNDTTMTNLVQNYGDTLGSAVEMYQNSYGIHHFHRHKTNEYGYYLYSKNSRTNVYVNNANNKYTFIEITKKNYIGLTEDVVDSYASSITMNQTNLYSYSDTFEVDYSEDGITIPSARYLEYYQGYIYFITYTNDSYGKITFKVHKIDATTYSKVDTYECSINIADLGSATLYPRFVNNRIAFTTNRTNFNQYLYVYNLNDLTFKSIEIPLETYGIATSTYLNAIKFYDTIAVVPLDKCLNINPIFVLDVNDSPCYNRLYFENSSSSYHCYEKIHTNDSCLNYPLANASNLYYYSSSDGVINYENQIIMPCVSSINVIDPIVKNSSNVLKISYRLKVY